MWAKHLRWLIGIHAAVSLHLRILILLIAAIWARSSIVNDHTLALSHHSPGKVVVRIAHETIRVHVWTLRHGEILICLLLLLLLLRLSKVVIVRDLARVQGLSECIYLLSLLWTTLPIAVAHLRVVALRLRHLITTVCERIVSMARRAHYARRRRVMPIGC